MRIFVSVVLLLGCVGLAWGHNTPRIKDGTDSHEAPKGYIGGTDKPGEHSHWATDGSGRNIWIQSITDEYCEATDRYDRCEGNVESSVVEESKKEVTDDTPVETTASTPVKTTTSTPVVYVSYTQPTHNTVVVLPQPAEIEQETVKVVVEQEIEPIEVVAPVIPKEYHEIQFYGGMNFVSMPVSTYGIQTVSDFWNQYTFLQDLGGIIFVYVDGEWLNYDGNNTAVGDIPLTPYTGLAVSLSSPSLLGLNGIPFENQSTIQLNVGANFVGFPTLPQGVVYPSDLIELGACVVVVSIKGKLYVVGRAGDDGDVEIQPNQALFVITKNPIQLVFQEVAAAPMAPRQGNMITTWGAVKQ